MKLEKLWYCFIDFCAGEVELYKDKLAMFYFGTFFLERLYASCIPEYYGPNTCFLRMNMCDFILCRDAYFFKVFSRITWQKSGLDLEASPPQDIPRITEGNIVNSEAAPRFPGIAQLYQGLPFCIKLLNPMVTEEEKKFKLKTPQEVAGKDPPEQKLKRKCWEKNWSKFFVLY